MRKTPSAVALISIHPPREGWDLDETVGPENWQRISIHPPREGWDMMFDYNSQKWKRFQSTHPVRGGTTLLTIA